MEKAKTQADTFEEIFNSDQDSDDDLIELVQSVIDDCEKSIKELNN
jgi:hypothetical protein